MLVSARLWVERYTNRSLLPQTWLFSCQTWPLDRIYLPRAPLIGLDFLNYTTINQQLLTVSPSTYEVNTNGDPGSIVLQFGQIWPPDPLSPSEPIQAQFQAGYPYVNGTASVDGTGTIVTDLDSPGLFNVQWTPNMWITLNGITSIIAFVQSPNVLILGAARPDLAGQGNIQWNVNSVPQPIKMAILQMATHMYGSGRTPVITGRGVTSAEISLTVKSLLAPYRISTMGLKQTRGVGVPIWP
jgi:hypothetical protein